MFYSSLLALHVLTVVIWVGGMFFAYNFLRPAAAEMLEPPHRLKLWVATFKRFFPWVWLSVVVILITGLGMMFSLPKAPAHILIMAALGISMMLIFGHVYFGPYKRLKNAVSNENWPEGAKHLGKIRTLVGINTIIGLVTIVIATAGRSWF
ncbi:MAG: CopD family protein [Cocleimonas sp.]